MDTLSSTLDAFEAGMYEPPPDMVTLDRLISMDDAQVRTHVGTVFTAQLQNSLTVHDVFFPDAPPPLRTAAQPWVADVAAALVAWSLALVSGHGFSRTADQVKAQAFVQARLKPDDPDFISLARENYSFLFPTHAGKDGVPFATYLADRSDWGQQLAKEMISPHYTIKELFGYRSDRGKFFQRLYCNLYKVRLLRPDLAGAVERHWEEILHERAFTAGWTVYDAMLSAHYTGQNFIEQVLAATNRRSPTGTGYAPNPAGGSTSYTNAYTYGLDVGTWLTDHAHYDFLTGAHPDNVERAPFGHCFREGTPILMADGTTKPIEEITQGEQVCGYLGEIEQRSPQTIVWPLKEGELLYGINDYPPFFTASHPFLTPHGWKAISPEAAQQVNPGLHITELKEGDQLLQIDYPGPTEPAQYRHVTISKITLMVADRRQHVHSLHLHRPKQSYHAHGFCVAVNHPEHTADHITDAFARLTAAERRFITQQLTPVLPLLKSTLGPYIEHILISGLHPTSAPAPTMSEAQARDDETTADEMTGLAGNR
ncbi:Hint domain-containing protein [Actinocorallia populi]|uniref:hypothetical protein n=1 Tax=Actinocorallia populi TaxID=2079200 RepID=UPI000D097834|nr:hypothetical protein [Actinocorallia populi]